MLFAAGVSVNEAGGGSPAARAERLGDVRRDELLDVPAERGDLLDEARREERQVLGGHEEDGLERRVEAPVHERHLELVLEVRQRAQAAKDERRAPLAGVVDQEPAE